MNHIVEAGVFGWEQALLVLAIVLLLFGGKKIPELMKGMGKGVKEFKDGMKGTDEKSATPSANEDDKK
ncbi:MAG: twin-arginine translocase TatA/TatE family subunit [Crocinitomicaceae bacterium]